MLGGLGGAVAEVLAEAGAGVRLHRHGIRDEYIVIGPPTHLYAHYRLDAAGIAGEVRAALRLGAQLAEAVHDRREPRVGVAIGAEQLGEALAARGIRLDDALGCGLPGRARGAQGE